MAASVVDSAVAAASAVTTTGVTVTHGFTLQNNDVLVAFVAMGDDTGTAFASSSGGTWTEVLYQQNASGSDRSGSYLRRVVTDAPNEPTTYTFTNDGGTTESMVAIVIQCRGIDTSTPDDATPVSSAGDNDFTPDAPDITTATDGALLLTCHVGTAGGSLQAKVGGAPSGFTLLEYGANSDNQFTCFMEVASLVAGSAGTQTIGAWTGTDDDATTEFLCFTVALRPASGAREMSGTPDAQAADATGTMSAPASASGTVDAGAATTDGTLQHRSTASGAPQAGAATADGTMTVLIQLSGSPQAGAATTEGTVAVRVSLSGTPQAGAAVADGTATVLIQLSGSPQAGVAVADGALAGDSVSLSGSPTASAATGAGVLDAIASAAGTPSADAALADGLLQHRFSLAGTPAAGAAASTGTATVLIQLGGAPAAGSAVSAGEIAALIGLTGAAFATAATSIGAVSVVVSMSGAPQAEPATSVGLADDGSAVPASAMLLPDTDWWTI